MDDNQSQGGLITRLTAWLAHPFSADMSVMNWVMFLGLILIAVFLWTRVLNHISE